MIFFHSFAALLTVHRDAPLQGSALQSSPQKHVEAHRPQVQRDRLRDRESREEGEGQGGEKVSEGHLRGQRGTGKEAMKGQRGNSERSSGFIRQQILSHYYKD